MESREAGAGPTSISPGATAGDGRLPAPAEAPEPSVIDSCLGGAKSGFGRTSRVLAPIVILALLPGLALTAVGVGAGRGWPIVPRWGMPSILLVPIGFYLVCMVCGCLVPFWVSPGRSGTSRS